MNAAPQKYRPAPLARFISADPLQFKYPYYTPFQYAGNKPVSFIDLDGAEEDSKEYWQGVNRITTQYGITNEGTSKIDQLKLQYINSQCRKYNPAGAKAVDNAKPSGTITATDSMADYKRNWEAMNSPIVNNWIKADSVIKGYSAGAFTSMAIIGGEAYVGEVFNFYRTNTAREIAFRGIKGAVSDGVGQYANNLLFQGKGWQGSY